MTTTTKAGHGPKISIFWKAEKRFDLEQKQFVHRLLINFRGKVSKRKNNRQTNHEQVNGILVRKTLHEKYDKINQNL